MVSDDVTGIVRRACNVALVGQTGGGKTTLVEALLHRTGALGRRGKVEDGTTVSDFEPEEVHRGASLQTAVATAEIDGRPITLLDSPGLPDFLSEAELALGVADVALFVISATDHLSPHTEALWARAGARRLPRVLFVNKLDSDRAAFEDVLEECRTRLGAGVAPLELPLYEGGVLVGVADLLTDEAVRSVDGGIERGPIPTDIADMEHRARESLVEGIVVGDDELMARYLDGETIGPDELEAALAGGLADGAVAPVLCGSAESEVALERLLRFLGEIPPTREVMATAAGTTITVEADPTGPPVARVFKTLLDPYLGKLSFLEVCSGTLRPDTVLVNTRTREEVRLHVLQRPFGKSVQPVAEASAGAIVVVPKLAGVSTGDTLAPRDQPITLVVESPPDPLVQIAIRPKSTGDDERLMTAIGRLAEEDPSLSVTHEEEMHQTVLGGMGDLHLQVALERLARKHHVEVETEPRAVGYRQTITKPAAAEGRYKKQSGGHGQFGIAHLRIEPGAPGSGFEFVDQVVGGAIPRQFIPAVEKGVRRAMAQGGEAGLPVVDVRVVLDDGKYHAVDSSELSFEQAGALAFSMAFAEAEPVVLEPIDILQVDAPARALGDVLSDLALRRARIVDSTADEDGLAHLVAEAPESEIGRYGVDLRAITGGYGSCHAVRDHYAPVPPHLATSARAPKR